MSANPNPSVSLPHLHKSHHFKVYHFNASSLCRPKRLDFCRAELLPHAFDIIAVSETWFHPAFTDSMAEIKGYTLVRNDRQGRGSGGVALYIKSNFSYKVPAASKDTGADKPEYLICEVSFSKTQILVAVVYRSPEYPLSYNTDFLDTISNLASNYSSKIILFSIYICPIFTANP